MKSSRIFAGAFAMLTMSAACGSDDEAPNPEAMNRPKATPAYTPTPPPGVLGPSPATAPAQQPAPAPQPPPPPSAPPVAGVPQPPPSAPPVAGVPQPPPPVGGAPAPAPAPAVDPEVRFGRGFAKCREVQFVEAEIIGPRCVLCHDQTKVATFALVDLRAAGWRNNLRGFSRLCLGRPLVVTRPTVGGFFFEQLAGPVMNCGDRMPPVGAALNAAEIECLKTYMLATE